MSYYSDMTVSNVLNDMFSDDEPKRVTATRWAVPTAIALDASSDHLVWHWDGAPDRWIGPGPMMLERFVGLSDATPERILAYARTWGVLGICEHGLPSSHNPGREYNDVSMANRIGCDGGIGHAIADGRWVFREPIDAWHRFAGEARTIALMAAALRGYGLGPNPSPQRRLTMTLDLRRALNRWLEIGAAKPSIVLHPDWVAIDPEYSLVPTIGAAGLFGALALRLSLAATGADGLAPCASCGEWFTPTFAPREGQRQWCSEKRCQKAKRAAASRAHRERERAGRFSLRSA